jgi:hypothetical protein
LARQIDESTVENAMTICNYIITEQNEKNIQITKEGKIKVFVGYSDFNGSRKFREMVTIAIKFEGFI